MNKDEMRIFEALFKDVSTQAMFQFLLTATCKMIKILEGRTNISERVSLGSTFQRFVAQI
jgi:hypothetical protein